MIGADDRLDNLTPFQWTIFVALSFGMVGFPISTFLVSWFFEAPIQTILTDAKDFGLVPLVVGAAIGAFLMGGLTWWSLVESPRAFTQFRAGVTGFLTGILSHVIMWLFHGLWMGEFAVLFLVYSIPIFGLVTGSIGALVGVVLVQLRTSGLDRGGSARPEEPTAIPQRLQNLTRRRWVLLVALIYAMVGLSLPLLLGLLGFRWGVELFFSAGVAGFLLGGSLWGGFVEMMDTSTGSRGTVVGGAIVVLTHFLAVLLWVSWELLWNVGRGVPVESGLFTTDGLLLFTLGMGVLSLAGLGIVTVPLGALVGRKLARLRQTTISGSQAAEVDDTTNE